MNSLRNKVQLIGNIGNSPEIKTLQDGKKVARFSLATNEKYKNAKGEQIVETQWHNVVAWGSLANTVEKYVDKGRELALEGKLLNRSYTDKEGVTRYITEIQLNAILLLNSKK